MFVYESIVLTRLLYNILLIVWSIKLMSKEYYNVR